MPGATQSAKPEEPAPETDSSPDLAEPIPPLPATGPVTVQVSPQGHITITVQPSTALVAPELALADVTAKGLFGPREDGQPGPFQAALDSLKSALVTLGNKIGEFAGEVATLEVRTYVSDRIEDVRPDGAKGFQYAQQRAFTYVAFDGDTQVVVPVDAGQIDDALWKIHLETVAQAQAHRQAMLKTVGELVTGFIPTLK